MSCKWQTNLYALPACIEGPTLFGGIIMSNDYVFNDTLPVAPLKIAALESCRDLAEKVNSHIINFRRNDIEVLKKRQENLQYRGYDADSYMLDCACPRFGSGEAKGIVNESVRGTDIYAMVDVTNYSLTYKMSGFTNHMSPDEGAMSRAVYLANNLGVDMGMFYKRRDYSRVVNGRNPIVAHEFLGSSVEGKTVLIIDDMISSGESMLDTCRALKERKAKRVVVCATFGLFTNGLEKFDEFFAKGYLDCVVTTNLNYHTPELLKRDWYVEADMSKFIAAIINSLNHNVSLENALTPTAKIQKLIKRYNEGQM